jgi:hypothetical protein
MDSKYNFELVYKTENSNYTITITEFDYSFEFIENELINLGMENDFDTGSLAFNDFTELNKCLDNNLYEEFFETYYNSYLGIYAFIAGLELGIEIDNIEDAYQGQYNSDAEFAEQITSDLYNLKDIPSYLVIDWDASSRDLMYDYSENDGYYFSNY